FNIPVIAVPDSYLATTEDAELQRLLAAIGANATLSNLPPEKLVPRDALLHSPGEYRRRFAVAPQMVADTQRLAERLTFRGPDFGLVMPPWRDAGRSAPRALKRAAYAGARKRYGTPLPQAVTRRLEHELAIIAAMGFAAYFLIVQEIVNHSSRTCGRGSGAASLVAYCLRITNVCPIKHNLYFERFLNPGRSDPPDIDVDFAWDERDAILERILKQFPRHSAMVANHVLFQPRMAVRETAKVFGLTDGEIGRVSKRLPWFWNTPQVELGLLDMLKQRPEAKQLTFPQPWPRILELAQKLVGSPRYLSVHPGGVVITPGPITGYVPLQTAPKGVPIVQWEKDAVEEAGLVKIDLLGNRSLGVIRDALANARVNGVILNEDMWMPEEDPATQKALAQGRTMGCFYIESPAMRLLQRKTGAGDFEHLVIHSSIIRPAANEFIREYIRRLHGGTWAPIHPLLGSILQETYGIMVYQEDVSRVAVALAGFSHGEADRLRKVMSKKDKEYALKDFHQRFAAGARAKGVAPAQIEAVWAMMMSFSGYSFCKPHSASYAKVSFQAAFLKVHHPAEFMAAVISNQGGFYNTFAYVSEARRMGLKLQPPDVNHSQIRWKGKGAQLRVGLMAVGGLSTNSAARIVRQRENQAYHHITDFLERVRPAESEARALILCGALDKLHPESSRAALLWELARWRKQRVKPGNRGLLEVPLQVPPPPRLPPDPEIQRLRREFGVLGFLCDRHPMVLYREEMDSRRVVKARDLGRYVGGKIRFAGWLITGKLVRTRQGEPMEFLTFEDETGIVESTFFPAVYTRFCHLLDRGRPYLLAGEVEQDFGALTLTVHHVQPL
ncbi:MAG: DNA polymerase III subunit alpha, partial [Desulfobacterales bacterium]